MIRVFLTPPEHRHYHDLVNPPASLRALNHETPAGQRELRIAALQSVIGMDHPRARIADDEVEVYGTRTEAMARWQ